MSMRITKPFLMLLIGLVVTGCSTSPALHVIGVYEGTRPVAVGDDVSKKEISIASPTQSLVSTQPDTKDLTVSRADKKYVQAPIEIASSSEQFPRVRIADRPEKEVVVSVSDTTQPLVLAFTAYEKTHWKVSLQSGVSLVKVILAGYHSQRISGIPTETPIETYTHDPSPCERCWQSGKYFYSYEKPPKQLKEITGLEPSSFQGRYRGTEFSIFPEIKKIE